MTIALKTSHLTKTHPGGVRACDDVSIEIPAGTITGLLGRNGAGKTSLMQLLTAQQFPTSGSVEIFGEPVRENAHALARTCFVRENQRYPDSVNGETVLRLARHVYPNWDEDFARHLVERFRLPLDRSIAKKCSRGQQSALGIVLGLASRAEITLLDEPYLGLDATSRRVFYDTLLDDYAAHPRTVLLSTHHIDESADLLERVIVIDEGRVIIDAVADELSGSALTVTGPKADVEAAAAGLRVLRRRELGGTAELTLHLDAPSDRERFTRLDTRAVSLQDLVVDLTEARS